MIAMPYVKGWMVAVAVSVAVVVAGAVTWVLVSAPSPELTETVLFEKRRSQELSVRIDSLSADASAAMSAANAASAKPVLEASGPEEPSAATASGKDVKTFAHIRKVTGPLAETFTVQIDPFLMYSGAEATKYAKSHKKKVPSNGILIVDGTKKIDSYPLAQTAEITAYTGGVEAMTPKTIDAGLLQKWVSDPSVISGASSDMWEITVEGGVITTIKMIAVAG
jgi:hypothetical protein